MIRNDGRTIDRPLLCLAVWLALASGLAGTLRAAAPRVLPNGCLPEDRRLEDLKDYDGYFPFEPSPTPEAWAQRAEQVRRQILVATGLWPMPAPTPAQAVVHGLVDRGDYTVEKVYFQSFPGHYVTGNLYRPKGKSGRLPGVLCPHGHWAQGRFTDCGLEEVRKRIVRGEERFEAGGRSPLQARCVQLARMGAVVFHYDMLGYADSVQISQHLAHEFATERPQMNTPRDWGLFSPQAELWLESVMGIQTYNSVRALDWLCTLPDVDPTRVGVTGASGGGTQTMLLAAIDARPRVAFPAVMVSTAMQGGCTCENCCLLRVGTGNVEFAALTAPRPLGMTGADDWTREIMTKGFPQLKQLYTMLGAGDNVMARALVQFPHNYNYVSREVMYHWFNQHLQMGLPEPVVEEDYRSLSIAEMSVWDADHPKPSGGEDYERRLLATMTEDAARQMAALTPHDSQSWSKYREVVGGAIDAIVGRELPKAGSIVAVQRDLQDRGAWQQITALLRYPAEEEELPVVILRPKPWNRRTVVWLGEQGKSGLYGDDDQLIVEARKLLATGTAIIAPDLLYQGEFLAPGQTLLEARRVKNPRQFAGFTLGYNRALCAQRAHDVLSIVSWLRYAEPLRSDVVALLALKGTAPWAATALAQARGAVDRAAIDTAGFRFADLKSVRDVNLLPGVVKYGDLPGLLSLAQPTKLWLTGEGGEVPAIIATAYRSAGQGSVTAVAALPDGQLAAAIQWLGE
ncbi:MAG TPA: acetylxylan esterase [Pirellulales bacterium]|jgi:dienelactone hydrolase|nr:acetylxylan esterase [Pirellulales bacterium]